MFLISTIRDKVSNWRQFFSKTTVDALEIAFTVAFGALIAITLVWIAIFSYVLFYYTYVPALEHVKKANLQFEPCDGLKGICSYPAAHVQLTKYNQFLMVGQPYQVKVDLEMPESPANKDLGMFMVCGRLMSKDGVVVANSCRSAMLKYYSPLVRMLKTLAMAPFYILGSMEEKQTISVELFSTYEEDQTYPVTEMFVEIRSSAVEVYSTVVHITAHLYGLRYIMYHFPILSAAFGISYNLCAIIFLATLSWWKLYGSKDVRYS